MGRHLLEEVERLVEPVLRVVLVENLVKLTDRRDKAHCGSTGGEASQQSALGIDSQPAAEKLGSRPSVAVDSPPHALRRGATGGAFAS